MKVLVISATFPPMRTGGAAFAFRLCQQLGERGVATHALTSQIPDIIACSSFEVSPIMRHWSWNELLRLVRVVRRFKPDVINLHFAGSIYQDQSMITLAPSLLRRLFPRLRIVTHIEYPEPADPTRLGYLARAIRKAAVFRMKQEDVDWGYGTILHQSDQVIVLSEDHIGLLAAHVPSVASKCVLIPPPPLVPIVPELDEASRELEREKYGIRQDEFVLAYFGLLYPGKGLESLLPAMQLLLQENRKVRLLIVGSDNEVLHKRWNHRGYGDEIGDLAKQLNVADKLHWSGDCPIDTDRGSRYLRLADACVLPFDHGVKLHRSSFSVAAAHGMPIVTTKSATTESVIVDGRNVIMCPPKNPRALADAIDSLISSPTLREHLQAGARNLAHEWFSWDTAMDRTLELFEG